MLISRFDNELRHQVISTVRRRYELARALHEPSGKLSASQLGKPLLEQVLKLIGVPGKQVEDYVMGLFARGDQVEDWLIDILEPDELQKEADYRGCIGYIDVVKDGRVIEVKSIKNSQVDYIDPACTKRIRTKDGMKPKYTGPKFQHVLQGGLYALSEDVAEYTIAYISCDDLRVYPHVIATEEIKPRVDSIITEVARTLMEGKLPSFIPREDFNGEIAKWQLEPKYSDYPDWITLDPATAMIKLERQFPDSYRKLKNYAGVKV